MKIAVNMKQKLGFIPDPQYISTAIHCPALGINIMESACPERILSHTSNAALDECRACPRGRMLMATVSGEHNYYSPEAPDAINDGPSIQEDISMPEDINTYTTLELAEMFGVKRTDINNAKCLKDSEPKPGSRSYKIREGMRRHGITWDQVVPAEKGGARPRKKVVPAQLADSVSLEMTPAACLPDPEAVKAELADVSPAHAAAREEVFTENEPVTACTEAEQAVPECRNTEHATALDDLFADNWSPEVPSNGEPLVKLAKLQAACGYDVILKEVPLEELVREITRRMPRAEVTLR